MHNVFVQRKPNSFARQSGAEEVDKRRAGTTIQLFQPQSFEDFRQKTQDSAFDLEDIP